MLATLTHVAGTWTHRKRADPPTAPLPESARIGVHRHARGDTVEGLDRLPGGARGKGRPGAALAGLLAILAGAWLVVGPSEWPVLKSTQQIVFAGRLCRCAASPMSSAPTWDQAVFSRSPERSPSLGRCGSRRSAARPDALVSRAGAAPRVPPLAEGSCRRRSC